jgi:hypothetical protein
MLGNRSSCIAISRKNGSLARREDADIAVFAVADVDKGWDGFAQSSRVCSLMALASTMQHAGRDRRTD